MKLRNKILAFALPLTLTPFALTALAVYYFVVRSYQIQIADEDNKELAQAIVDMRREQEAARRDVTLMASLPAIADYLERVSFGPQNANPGSQTSATGQKDSFQTKEVEARANLQLFFDRNPYYIQLSLIDAQGQERVKFSKLPGPNLLRRISGEDSFRRMLVGGNWAPEIQLPVESAQPGRFTSTFTSRVRREKFAGGVALNLDTAVFERHLRRLLADRRLSTFLFDDRGLVFAKSFAGAEEESCMSQINFTAEANALLAQPALTVSGREVQGNTRTYLFSMLPAEEFISSMEPGAGENWFLGVLQPKGVVVEQTRTFQIIFFVILMFALAGVIGATTHYSRRFTEPLEQMAGATTRIARGHFDIQLGISTGDEVEQLATAVKRMADDLKTYQAELIKSAKLAAIGEMAAEVSHEIQNRISGMSLWIQYLDSEIGPQDPKREYLQEMKQGLQGFLQLLADLKQFYKTPILQMTDVNLNSLVKASLRNVDQRINEDKIEIDLRLDPSLPMINCDRDKIQSVIINLLINAVESGGNRIVVQTGLQTSDIRPPQALNDGSQKGFDDGKAVLLSVTDNGHGIREEDLPRIFYPFHSTKAGGGGLGLSIASNLVKAHGGRIEVESTVGAGTKFSVSFQT